MMTLTTCLFYLYAFCLSYCDDLYLLCFAPHLPFYLYAFFLSYCDDLYLLCFASQIQEQMLSRGLELVGWYHSHPVSLPNPSHNDILSQRMYQYKMMTSGGDEPCVGIVVGEGVCV